MDNKVHLFVTLFAGDLKATLTETASDLSAQLLFLLFTFDFRLSPLNFRLVPPHTPPGRCRA